ncbi:MAG: hypothetical protein H3C54_04170 [Taibaiella sp.]|nr:hypothetical protein [Taibaiella sp.]
MNKYQAFLFSLSILAPAITGVIRYRNIPVSYHPVIYLLLLGVANELTCYFFFYNTSNALPTNIYFLCEFLLFAWQFHNWKNILRARWLYLLLIIGMSLLWVTENIILGRLTMFSPVFQVAYSLALILLAINQLSWLVVNDRGRIMTNPVFIISIAVIIFFSYKVLTEIFYYYAATGSIKNNIFVIESYLNVGYNIMLTIALICIPPKSNFIRL